MIAPRLVLCSGAVEPDDLDNRRILRLDAIGNDTNVNIRIENISRALLQTLNSRQTDLLEIASYVFAADSAVSRGSAWLDSHSTEPWSRDFKFIIPVRDHEFWNREDVQIYLQRILNFLSDDHYQFEFPQLMVDRPVQQYLELNDAETWPFAGPERVLMFSGGLDSLSGAAESAHRGENVVLVSHRSVARISARQKDLVCGLSKHFQSVRFLHVPVWVNKSSRFGREHTQRTRSFLFAVIGFVVADSIGANGVRFFENGIISLNLPIADEVLRSRASRTTHPQSLAMIAELLSLVSGRNFKVDNPYITLTKKEVIEHLVGVGAPDLISKSCSCAHTMFQTKSQAHCGTCSQCIDRRVAILSAGQEGYDPETDYVSDVFFGPRKEGYEQNVAIDYVRLAYELEHMSDDEIAQRFSLELSRATRPFQKRSKVAGIFVEMHRRHANSVVRVIEEKTREATGILLSGQLDATSAIALIAGLKHLEPNWKRYCEKISYILEDSIPALCREDPPKNETDLQKRCDAVLKSHDMKLIREYPFLRWGSVSTKPDWSSTEQLCVWVELKYVRKKEDIRRIHRDVAEDITKYGDNNCKVLFLVYDPHHLADDNTFLEPVHSRSDMIVRFLR